MSVQGIGEPVTRNEDARLLSGRAQFIDDVRIGGMRHAAFLRSPHAHARILAIDTAAARARPGVLAVFTAADLGALLVPGPLAVPPPPVPGAVFHQRTQLPLARDVVRHVGEAVAMVVAESRYIAEDALGDITVDWEPLPVAADLERAARPDAPRVHADLPDNTAARVHQTKGDYATAVRAARRVIRRRLRYDHGASMPMETRGVVAQWDGAGARLTLWDTTQAPVVIRNVLAGVLGLSERQLRVIAPFIGGGFGPKIMVYYPEELLVSFAAMRLDVPVKWIEDRVEHFTATTHEREQIHEAEIALDADGRILGVRDEFLCDTGAYDPYGLTVPLNSQCTLLGPYMVPHYDSRFTVVFTHKTTVTPYRGAGRQHGVFVIERLLDAAAHEMGIDRAEIRRRNFIAPDAFPYDNAIIYQDFSRLTYDSGNYAPMLERLKAMIDYDAFLAVEQPRLRAAGRRVGLGLVCYVEGTGIGPYEGARVQVQSSGRVSLVTGIGTQGQGHFTSFAQLVAAQLGIPADRVDVVTGDTDQFYWGAGTFASRGAVVAGNAVHQAATAVRAKVLRVASEAFECDEADLEIVDGRVRIAGVPGKALSLGELAVRANPMRGAVRAGTEPGLEATSYFGPESGATAAGMQAAILEVDPETFEVTVLRFAMVHDCGTVINPLIVEGQVQGGIAQGIGNAFYEKLAYDDEGQLRNASLADYLIPGPGDVPDVDLDHTVTPSPLNPLGIKGVGEAGAIPVGALFAQAIEDAMQWPAGDRRIDEIPLSPDRLWAIAGGLNDH